MSYGMTTGALSRDRSGSSRTIFALAFAIALMLALTLGSGSASAAFKATGWTLGATDKQAGSHPAVTVNAAIDPVQGDANGDDLKQLQIELPAGLLFNPQAIATPCPTASFNSDTCAAATQVGSISVSYRVAGKINTATGSVYSITPDSNSVINFGFVVRPSTSFQKLFFTSGRATGLTTVRSGLDKDYGLNILVPNIPRTIKSSFGISTSMTISNIAITFNPRSGASQTGGYFVFSPTRCDAANSRVTFTSYAGASQQLASGYVPTGCDKPAFSPTFALRSTNTNAGQSTGIVATVTQNTSDQPIQPSEIRDIRATLPAGTTVNLGVINSTPKCSETQLAADACPSTSKIGTATVNVPFLPAAMTGEIYLTSSDPIQFAYIIRGARGTIAILRGSAGVDSGVVADFQMLPQVPWSSATLSFTSLMVNNPVNSCPSATSWGYFTGYTEAQMIYGTMYPQTNCPPDTTITTTSAGPYSTRTPSFEFASNPAGATAFQCRVDLGSYAACSSPYTLPSLTEGAHTFYVRALSSSGVADPSPASKQFTVDTTAPTITITSPAEGQSLTTNSATLNYTTEPGASNYCRLDSAGITTCTSPKTYTGLTDGAHRIRIITADDAGNVAYLDRNFTVTTTKPLAVKINNPTEGQQLVLNEFPADFTVSDGTGAAITSTVCRLYSLQPEDLSDVQLLLENTSCTQGSTIGMDQNSDYRFEVEVTDASGSVAVASVKFKSGIRRPSAPSVTDSVSRGRLTNRSPKFYLQYDDPNWPDVALECAFAAKGATPTYVSCGTGQNPGSLQPTSPLTDGSWVFWMRSSAGSITGFTSQMPFTVGPWDATYTMTPSTTQAGAHPDLDINVTPNKAGQWKKVDMTLPRGLIGSLNSVSRCADAGIPTGTCDPASQIGTVSVRYQIASLVIATPAPGEVYFTNPQVPGDAAGMVIHVHAPIDPFADVIIPLRVQLVNNAQQMRIFSDTIPTVVGDIYEPDKFTQFWVNKFDMHVNGAAGSPQPLLTNPSRCGASEFTGTFGDTEGNYTPAATIPFQATGCDTLPFAPTISQSFSDLTAAAEVGLTTDITLPSGNSSMQTVEVSEPGPLGPNYPAFGRAADRCPGSAAPDATGLFDPTNCNSASLVGTMSIVSPLLTEPLTGSVYLINKSPVPWLGVKLVGEGILVRLYGETKLVKLDPTCGISNPNEFCPTRVVVKFDNLPDLPLSSIHLDLNRPDRKGLNGATLSSKLLVIPESGDTTCTPESTVDTVFTPYSGAAAVNAQQGVSISGC